MKLMTTKNTRQMLVIFDDHADAAVRHRAHCLMENIQGFTGSHWMQPSGKCLCRIAPAAAMVDGFVETTLNIKENTLKATTIHFDH